jgi:CBS domain-containing protein
MQAKDVMTSEVVTVTPATPVAEIAKRLLERRISAVPVVDENRRILGIVSEGDLMRRAETGTERKASWWLSLLAGPDDAVADYVKAHGRTAADVMTRDVVTVGERVPLERIATLLERSQIKRVPVVRGGKLVGIVSRANLLHGLATRKPGVAPGATDRVIRARVVEEIRNAGVDQALLSVVVSKGIVQMWGTAYTAEQKRAARVAAENTPGVRRVTDHVAVLPQHLRAVMGAE